MAKRKITTSKKANANRMKLKRETIRDLDVKDRGKKVKGGSPPTRVGITCCALTGSPV